MRVVAGTYRGRRLVAPPGTLTRPTSDRVREAIFNTLFGLVDLTDTTVVDLFAGSGALGIEALSRGAASAVFVDDDRQARAAITANLTALGLTHRAKVVAGDAITWVERAGRPVVADVVFADPPYGYDRWDVLLAALTADIAVLESDRVLDGSPAWEVLKVKRYGGTVVTFCGSRAGSGNAQTRAGSENSQRGDHS